MTTPRKSFNYNSPYAKPVQQYPSQSEDYISLDMGGPMHDNKDKSWSNEKTPGRYYPKYYQQNHRNSNSKANRRNLFNNDYGQQNNRKSFNQQQRYGPRSSNERPQQQNITNSNEKTPQQQQENLEKKEKYLIASYCHPSMTEDPWYELIERLRALEKSKISLNETSSPNPNSPPADTCSNPASDNGQDDSLEGE